MMIAPRAFLVLASLLAFAGQAFAQTWEGRDSAAGRFTAVVARDAGEWAELWKLAGREVPAEPVDFASRMALGIFLGARPTGGYAARIDSVADEDGLTVVAWSEHRPGKGSIVTQALTAPWIVRLVPRSGRPVLFRGEDGSRLPSSEQMRLKELVGRLREADDRMSALERGGEGLLQERERLKAENERLRRQVDDLEDQLRRVREAVSKP